MLRPKDAGSRDLVWVGPHPMPAMLMQLAAWGWRCQPWHAHQTRPDLVILSADAIWQAACSLPFLVICCLNADQRLAWLRRGAGDALCRDASAEELHWRAQRLLASDPMLQHGDVVLDPVRHSIRHGHGPDIGLKPREFALLHALVRADGQSLSRHDLLQLVWRIDFDPGTNGVAVHIHRLRARLAEVGLDGLIITTHDGRYGLRDPAKLLESQTNCGINRPENAQTQEDCHHDRSPPRYHRFSGRRHCRCAAEPRGQDERAGPGHVQWHRRSD